jgi:hypothetical protein
MTGSTCCFVHAGPATLLRGMLLSRFPAGRYPGQGSIPPKDQYRKVEPSYSCACGTQRVGCTGKIAMHASATREPVVRYAGPIERGMPYDNPLNTDGYVTGGYVD